MLSRKRRLRTNIKENLALAEELDTNTVLKEHTPVALWMHKRIVVDVARLTGEKLGTPKKPVAWGTVVFALILAGLLGAVTYYWNRNDFAWYSIFPATISALLLISVAGMFMNRDIAPDSAEIPANATPLTWANPGEKIAASIAMSAEEAEERYADYGQVGVAVRFVSLLHAGKYEEALELAEPNWLLCRVQDWLVNNKTKISDDEAELALLAESLSSRREPEELWRAFTSIEAAQFSEAWKAFDPESIGIASRERLIGNDYARVILTPIGGSSGYVVETATHLANALVILVHRDTSKWIVSSHLGIAPPAPGLPPAWWILPSADG
ncbi:hypothetical protein M1L60_13145 [Actinoplanes sp. TRM 88003]|uniref:Uncharacterized protein n=1 Tax=Paractinoplanes aksuensis TaxID=2939490 RepID=A0ABT1DL22_9ACTN|nr:hypothetical protein [Actinoplanes aksuensis]MCO8271539.1 hypothetical protein [Actinoplanes aksuensis]